MYFEGRIGSEYTNVAPVPATVPPTERTSTGMARFHLLSMADTVATRPPTACIANAKPTKDSSLLEHLIASAATALPMFAMNIAIAAAVPAKAEDARKYACRADRPSACLHAVTSAKVASEAANGRKPELPAEAGMRGNEGLAIYHFAISAS